MAWLGLRLHQLLPLDTGHSRVSHSGCQVCTGTHAIRNDTWSAMCCKLPHEAAHHSPPSSLHAVTFPMPGSMGSMMSQNRTLIPTF